MATVVLKPGFFGMLQGIYSTVGTLSSAATHAASAIDNLAIWADESTGTFVDEARMEREIKVNEFRQRLKLQLEQQKSLAISDATVKE